MSSFREAVGVATKSAICTVLAGAEATSYVSRIGIPAPGSQTVINTLRSARRAVCDNPDAAVDVPAPSFSGGQCLCTDYRVEIKATYVSSLNPNGDPVVATFVRRCTGPVFVVEGTPREPLSGAAADVEITANAIGSSSSPPACQPEGSRETETGTVGGSVAEGEVAEIEVTVEPATGGPDDCGDPDAPPIPPYQPVTISRDVTYVDASETEITEEGDFTINAPVIIGGNIIAPVSIDLGGVVVPVELNLSTGDLTFEFEGGDTPAPTDDEDDDIPPPDDEPNIEEDLLIYGLIVYSTPTTGEGSVTSEIAQGDAPLLLLPRTGNVWFQVPVGDRVTWAGPIPVQSQNQLVRVPDGMAASGYRLFPNTGWQLSEVRMGKPPCGCVSV